MNKHMCELGTRRRFLKRAALIAGLFWAAIGPATALADCRLSVLGDSLAAGYGVAMEEAFPAQLERALSEAGVPCEVLNAGVSGDTSAGGLARLDWVLGDEPTHLMVELGGNDALRALPVETLEENLARIIEKAQAEGVFVMLAGMLAPPNLGARYTEAFKAVYARLAERYDVAFYPFFLDGVIQDPSLMADDGIHPNAAGVAAIVERMLPHVRAWLEATSD